MSVFGSSLIAVGAVLAIVGAAVLFATRDRVVTIKPMSVGGKDRQVVAQGWTETPADTIKRVAFSEPRFLEITVSTSEMSGDLLVDLGGWVETENDLFDARIKLFEAQPALRKKIAGHWIGGVNLRQPPARRLQFQTMRQTLDTFGLQR